MAFVHPSRMALVPKDSGFARPSGSRLQSPPASPPHPCSSSANRVRDRSDDYYHHRRKRDEDERRRDRGRSSDRDVHRDGERHQSPHHSNGDRPSRSSRSPRGRASPRYDDYSRRNSTPPPPPSHDDSSKRSDMPPENGHPWRQQENMYRRDGRFDGGGDYFEKRRQQRVNNTFSIWPPSPRAPARNLSPERHQQSRRKHKRERSTSVSSSSTDSEEDRRRRERKERKRARKERERRGRRHRTYSDDEDRERHRDSRRKRSRSTSREPRKTRSRSRSPRRERSSDEDEWVEKSAPSGSFVPTVPTTLPSPTTQRPSATRIVQKNTIDGDVSDEEVGPQPAAAPSAAKKLDERAYGGALLRGEGSAMAAFLQDGTDVRIPRRGEIGLTSGEIGDFESVGYVMSGSRHRRMNAVRMRKENQVISAEEKRGILKLQQEEKQRREAILREEFQELLTDRLKGTEGTKASS